MMMHEHFKFIFFMNVYNSSKSKDLLERCSKISMYFFQFIFFCKLYSFQNSIRYCFVRLYLFIIKTTYCFARQYQAIISQSSTNHYPFYQQSRIIFGRLPASSWGIVVSIKNQFFAIDFHTRYFTHLHNFLSLYSYLLLLSVMLPFLSFEVHLCIIKGFPFLFYQQCQYSVHIKILICQIFHIYSSNSKINFIIQIFLFPN